MKFRWKIFLTSIGIAGLIGMGMYFSAPTADASLSLQQKERIIITNEVSNAVKRLCPSLDPGVRDIIVDNIYTYSTHYALDPVLVVSIIYRESGFRLMSVSSANCVGLMQINPAAHKEKIKDFTRDELFYIENNVRIGCQILKEYYSKGKTREALRRYVGGNHPSYVNDVLSTYAVLKLEKEG